MDPATAEAVNNSYMMEIVIFFVTQSIIIIGFIVGAYVRTQVAIERVRGENNSNHVAAMTRIDEVKENTRGLKSDHGSLAGQVGGIARGLARLEGHVYARAGVQSEEDEDEYG